MMSSPSCQRHDQQVKVGLNPSGDQRFQCKVCRRKDTPKTNPQGYSAAVRQRAVQMYVDGGNFRRIARALKVAPQSVVNGVNARAAQLPESPPSPAAPLEVNELDELFTFVGQKKTKPTSSRR